MTINGNILRDAILSGSNNISAQKYNINDLNIFPVPDGDTGTNMSMSIDAAVKEISGVENASVGEIAAKAASAMLRGARGNSGVILSLLFRGFARGLEGKDEADGRDIACALGLGVDAAYKAVMKPTEGTILTIARMAFEKADSVSKENNDINEVWRAICETAYEALEQTPKLLPVLKKAGVVDAGGKGLCVIFDGMRSVFENGIIIAAAEEEKKEEDFFRSAAAEFDEVINFTYCTEYIVGRDSEVALEPNELRLFLETIGDCVVVVDDDDIIKVHVHTDMPGDALKKGLEFGQLLTVKVENMREQHKQAKTDSDKKKKRVGESEETPSLSKAEPVEGIGFVAVAAGKGLSDLFHDLGCTNIVNGGQSMNPNTDSIYEAIMATPAKTVFVLPNNKNIIMAAEQTLSMVSDRTVIILPVKTIPQGLSAMLAYDPDMSVEDNKEAMLAAIENVKTGQVTFAARNSEFGGRKIKEGEIIALDNGKLTITDKTPVKAVYRLAKDMVGRDTSFITLIYGEDVTEDEASEAMQLLEKKFPNVEITLVNGGQPVYYFILSVE